MKILITGGNGDIAKSIRSMFLCSYDEIWIETPGKGELDVTDENIVRTYITSVKPDVLINCAGYIETGLLADISMTDFRKHFDVNVFGALLCSKEAVKNGCRTIINIGSTSSFESKPSWGAYCSSKAALVAITEAFSKEGISCYGLHPGRTATKMRKRLFPDEDTSTLSSPSRIASFVFKIINNEFSNGSQIIVFKNHYYILGSRTCVR